MNYLIAIPVFNEIKYVEEVLTKVRRYHNQIVFVDDGSTDGTAELLAARSDVKLVRHDQNRGYGQSIIDAFAYACREGFEWVITMDCDEQHEPEMIPSFVEEIKTGRWDIISGSRYMKTYATNDAAPGDRRAINMTITAALNELFDFGITDAFCGFKAHRVSAMSQMRLDETGYAFPLQFWPRAAAMNLRITEIPVRLIYNDPNRQFGGGLDDAKHRLAHYREVLSREIGWMPADLHGSTHQCAVPSCCCSNEQT